jgi:hypothetical protein
MIKLLLTLSLSVILLAPAFGADGVSREQAIQIAKRFMRHSTNIESLKCDGAWIRWGDFAEEPDPSIRIRLNHRKYWFVHFVPRDWNIAGGGHRLYVAADTGEILGWNLER